jgi:hypothetical protein
MNNFDFIKCIIHNNGKVLERNEIKLVKVLANEIV